MSEAITSVPVSYKYKFLHWLLEVPAKERPKLKKEVAEYCSVEVRTVSNWLNLQANDKHDMPHSAVVYLCQRLGKPVESARNYHPGHELNRIESISTSTKVRRSRFGLS